MSIGLSHYCSLIQPHNNLNNYKGSGLPKFQKFKHRVFPGNPPVCETQIIESVENLQRIIKTNYNHSIINLTDIIRLYGDDNIQVTNDIILRLSISDINMVREYTRDKNIYSSKNTPQQYEELMEDIRVNGFKECGRIRLTRNIDNDIEVILGEGNHRLSIAKQLKLPVMPIRLVYTT